MKCDILSVEIMKLRYSGHKKTRQLQLPCFFEIYDIKVFVKRALLIDRYSRQSKSYYFIYTANLQPTDVNKDFNVVEFEEGKFKFIVSFDFAESLARREVEGIEFIEVEEDVV